MQYVDEMDDIQMRTLGRLMSRVAHARDQMSNTLLPVG